MFVARVAATNPIVMNSPTATIRSSGMCSWETSLFGCEWRNSRAMRVLRRAQIQSSSAALRDPALVDRCQPRSTGRGRFDVAALAVDHAGGVERSATSTCSAASFGMDSRPIRFGSIGHSLRAESTIPVCRANEGICQRGFANATGFDDISSINLECERPTRLASSRVPSVGRARPAGVDLGGGECVIVCGRNV